MGLRCGLLREAKTEVKRELQRFVPAVRTPTAWRRTRGDLAPCVSELCIVKYSALQRSSDERQLCSHNLVFRPRHISRRRRDPVLRLAGNQLAHLDRRRLGVALDLPSRLSQKSRNAFGSPPRL